MSKWKNDDIVIAKELLESGFTYKEIGLRLNKSDMAIRAKISKTYNIKRTDFHTSYNIKQCLNCNVEFSVTKGNDKKYNHKFCSNSCSATYNNKLRTATIKNKNCLYCDNELKTGTKYCNGTCQSKYIKQNILNDWLTGQHLGTVNGGSLKLLSVVREYIINRAFNKCEECDENRVNPYSGKSILTIDHIDGDASNNKPNNLKVLCPSCHAMTSTFGCIGNRVSARKAYRKKYRPGLND
jgi:hypothetical protein